MAATSAERATLGAAFGEGFAVLHYTVKDVVSKARMFTPILKRLESTLDSLVPTVNEISQLSEDLELPERKTKRLMEQMEEGEKLVTKCLKIRWWNYVFKVQYFSKLEELDKEIIRFCQLDLQALCTRNGLTTLETVISINKKVDSFRGVETRLGGVSGPQDLTVGLDMPIKELKTLLLKEEVKLLLLTAPVGCGKTTLVKMLCQEKEIKGIFKDNILFVYVSKTPNVKVIVQNLFDYKYMQPKFQIQSDEDAFDQLSQLLNHISPNPILLILDDVWLGSESLPEKFKFDIPNYKILVTSRTAFPRFEFTYHLEPLNDEDAMTLFRHSASLKEGSTYIPPEEDIEKIVRGCGGFPLVIKVIGGSLCRQQAAVWRSRLMKWSDDQFYFSYDTELLACFQKSLEFPNSMVIIKECFMDLCSFTKDQSIPLAALIDMWAELYKLDEDGIHAIANLQELNIRNLASLVMASHRKDASEVKRYYNEDFVTQHVILRELAMHQISQESIGQRSRLIINISGNNLPKWWIEKEQQLINACLLSISTDELFSSSWCNIQGSKVEVLVLNFHTRNYTLPEFVEKMDKIKVLIINNYGFFHCKIRNFQLLGSLPNLKRIRLVKISISSLCNTLVPLKSLKKISLFMCNIGKAFENCTIQVSDAFPNLTEINIDCCNDLEELPVGLCDIVHLKKISITNCHKLSALPEETGKLVNLEVLRLRSCTDLSELPNSIRSLHKLSILDISDCLSIVELPKHIGELCNLKELNMKGCLRLHTQFPKSIMDLEQLKLVVCDKEWAKLWEPIKEFLSNLEVEVAEKESVNLFLQKLDSTICSHPDFTVGMGEVAEKESVNLILQKVDSTICSPSAFTVGLDMPMKELKMLLLKEEVQLLFLISFGGFGKSTMGQMLCQEDKMKVLSVFLAYFILWKFFLREVVKEKRYNHHHHHGDHDISGISAGPMEPLLLVNSLSHNDYMSVRSSLMEPLLLVDSLSHSDYMSVRSSLSLSSLSSSSLSSLPKPQALPMLELGIVRPKERLCSVDFLFPSPKTCPRRGLEDRDRDRDRDSACSNSPIRSEFASCETRDVKKSMDYGDKSCRQENPEKNGSESSREIPSTEMIPGLHPPAFFGSTAFSSDTSSLHSPLGAAITSPSAPTSQPIAKSESVPAFSSDNSSLHSPLGAAMPSPSAPTPQPIAKSKSVPMNSQWHKRKHIGSGAFGHVYVAINRETGALCAMKEVVLIPDDPGSAECIMQLQQEIKFLSQLKHPNIVQYYGSEIVNDRFYIYLEYVHPGSINNYVREHCEAITESVVRNFTRHILSGLAYLHGKKTVHRDIKGANLLVNSSGVVKLADFGLAKHLTGPAANLSIKGTYHWMAPEIFKPDLYADHCHSSDLALAVDIWSLGCTIIEMITGKPPWSEFVGPVAAYRAANDAPPIPETLSSEGREFLQCCLKRNPAERPSAAKLLEHRFLKNMTGS